MVICREEERETELSVDMEVRFESARKGDRAVVELSMNFVIGLTSSKTMKLQGEIKGKGVIVMIDPGATHNFI